MGEEGVLDGPRLPDHLLTEIAIRAGAWRVWDGQGRRARFTACDVCKAWRGLFWRHDGTAGGFQALARLMVRVQGPERALIRAVSHPWSMEPPPSKADPAGGGNVSAVVSELTDLRALLLLSILSLRPDGGGGDDAPPHVRADCFDFGAAVAARCRAMNSEAVTEEYKYRCVRVPEASLKLPQTARSARP